MNLKHRHIVKGLWRSRTIKFLAIPLGALGVLQACLPMIQANLSPRTYGWIAFGVAVAVGWLRAITRTSLEERGKDDDERIQDAARSQL